MAWPKFLRPKEPEPLTAEQAAIEAQKGSVAWAEPSALLQDKKYNPDDLIGRKGFEVYKRMMLDEQVKAVVHFKRASVTGRQWFFDLDFEKHGLSEKEAKRRVDIFTDMLEVGYKGSIVDGLNAIMKAQWQGFSITEQMFRQFESGKKTWWGLHELKPKPFDTFYPVVDDRGQVHRWIQQGGVGFQEKEIDLRKFVYYRYNPDMDEHYGWSELRSAYRGYLAKDITISLMNVFVERLAGGFPVASPKEGHFLTRDSQEFKDLQNIMKNLTGKSSVIMPSGIELELVQAQGGNVTVFEKAIEIHDLAIAKALLMPNLMGLSHTGQTGAYSQSETQFDVFMIVADDESGRLEDAVNEQVFSPLGKVNFPDGIAPRFHFKPLSQRKRMQMLKTWVELVTAGAAIPSDSDERHVRDLMDFPEKGEVLVNPLKPAPAGDPGREPRKPVGQGDNPERPGDDIPETIRGNPVSASAFARAVNRVAFAVIDRQAQLKVDDFVPRVEEAVAETVAEGLSRIEADKLGADPSTADQIGKFELSKMRLRTVNTQVKRALQAGVNLGEDHAKREIDKAKGERFARLDFDRLGDLAQTFLNQRAFTISGDLKAGLEKVIHAVLLNAIKFTWTTEQIRREIYKRLVSEGFVSGSVAADALGLPSPSALSETLALTGGLAAYRLDTVIRTNLFEAVNEARFNVFTDPDLDGFVRALEYSAILDSRTTPICSNLSGRVYSAADWQGKFRHLTPPNHFNAVAEGTLIRTASGDKPIESVELGDSVLTHRSRFRKVYSTMHKQPDTSRILELHQSTGRRLRITDEHPVLTTTGWRRADELKVGDVLFENSEEFGGASETGLPDPNDFPSLFDEPPVAWDVVRFASGGTLMRLPIYFESNEPIGEGEVDDVPADNVLHREGDAAPNQEIAHQRFVNGGLCPPSGGFGVRGFVPNGPRPHGIVAEHSGAGIGALGAESVMLGARSLGDDFGQSVGDADLFVLAANGDTVPFAPALQNGLSDPYVTLDRAEGFALQPVPVLNEPFDDEPVGEVHMSTRWEPSTIIAIVGVEAPDRVWNLAVEDDETYLADGLIVHNCRSLLIPVTEVDEDVQLTAESPSVEPQQGFG